MTDVVGTAKVIATQSTVVPRIDGDVLTDTRAAQVEGANGSPMPIEALDAVREQVQRLMTKLLRAYEDEVAVGEVGPSGSAIASTAPPKQRCPTGLLYGLVQSGKTLAMITATAMALDNGFRVIVVLTSDNVSLVKQTADRFRALRGVNVKDSTDIGSWLDDGEHLRTTIGEGGLVLVLAKNSSHLDRFIEFLRAVGAPQYPALILDDEADQASLDTNTAKRATAVRKGKTTEVVATAINRKTNENLDPKEKGNSIREVLRHHVYLQVTATPYALLLQNPDNALRPSFAELLEPGFDYTGGDFFFSKNVVDNDAAPNVTVAENESLDAGEMPDGLRDSLSYFLVAAAAQGLADRKYRSNAQNYLCHSSRNKTDHNVAADLVRAFLQRVKESLGSDNPTSEGMTAVERGLRELARTVTPLPDKQQIIEYIRKRLQDRDVKIVNSEQDNANFGPKLNFIIGGNILGRGLTIENLLVTYYLRSAKVTQMDTMLQHARMFGYRRKAKPFLRVYMPKVQMLRFAQICSAEEDLRKFIEKHGASVKLPVHVTSELRATRSGVLDARNIGAFVPGQHVYPMYPYYGRDADARFTKAKADIARLLPSGKLELVAWREPMRIDFDVLLQLLDIVPYDENSSISWDPEHIKRVLDASRDKFSGAYLTYRSASRTKLSQGMLSGDELDSLRSRELPVFCLFEDKKKELKLANGSTIAVDYLFPELVFPDRKDIGAIVFNEKDAAQ
jgi:hypothetical protein